MQVLIARKYLKLLLAVGLKVNLVKLTITVFDLCSVILPRELRGVKA